MDNLKRINKGMLAYCLALIQIAYIIVISIVDISGKYMLYATNTYLISERIGRVVVALISLILGLVAIFQKESKKVRIYISIIISVVVLLGPVWGIIKAIFILLKLN